MEKTKKNKANRPPKYPFDDLDVFQDNSAMQTKYP